MGAIVLLGPQRLKRTLADAVRDLGVEGPIATITAGWQEREDEIDELSAHLDRPVRHLRLHARAESILEDDFELFVAHRERTAVLIELHELYRLQLRAAKEVARELFRRTGDREILEPERQAAIDALRRIDERHMARIEEVSETFREQWNTGERPAVVRQRRELKEMLEGCGGLAIAGGHVGVLRNRLRLFDIGTLAAGLTVFAWSAGSMCVCEKVVLFHDDPPEGAGDAEILGEGLGLCPGVVALPHARRRLRLDDPVRVQIMARRFAPLRCVGLDEGSRWVALRPGAAEALGVRLLESDGSVTVVGATP